MPDTLHASVAVSFRSPPSHKMDRSILYKGKGLQVNTATTFQANGSTTPFAVDHADVSKAGGEAVLAKLYEVLSV